MAGSDETKKQSGIPAWQRSGSVPARVIPSSRTSSDQADGSDNTANKGVGAREETAHAPGISSRVYRTKTDGSDVAAAQASSASESPSEQVGTTEDSSSNRAATDGSDLAAKQEFDASKEISDTSHVSQPVDQVSTDGSAIAAKQEFEASKTVLDQVRKFLHDPQVSGAPTEKKRDFLRSKGVQQDIIEQVLEEQPSNTFSAAEFQNSRPKPTPPRPEMQKDLPPVVTYPEFLIQPQKPPPLVTLNRLLNTAYVTGGIVASIYGLSKFIISPMAANLCEARHDFAEHASSHLNKVNDRLSTLVSTIPTSSKAKVDSDGLDESDDSDSTVSDPTELFHRDIGTQTSPLSPTDEKSSLFPATLPEAKTASSKQQTDLKTLHSLLSELLSASDTNGSTVEDIQTEMTEFRHSLDAMVYSPSAYQYLPGETVFTSPGTPKAKNDDAVTTFKSEIRGVKGVLLSAKRFPPPAAVR